MTLLFHLMLLLATLIHSEGHRPLYLTSKLKNAPTLAQIKHVHSCSNQRRHFFVLITLFFALLSFCRYLRNYLTSFRLRRNIVLILRRARDLRIVEIRLASDSTSLV